MADPKNIDEALHALQAKAAAGEIVVRKNRDGQVGNQRTRYADLVEVNAQVLTALNELGCVWKCRPTQTILRGRDGQEDPRFVLVYSLKHVASGTEETGEYPLPGGANPMQNGSAITYARRYALLAVTGIAAEDDDDDGGGYGGGRGMAQRANARQRPAEPTAQRAAPAARAERARPAGQPPLPEPPISETALAHSAASMATDKQLGMIAGELKKLGVTERDDRLTAIVMMIGREIGSGRDLTKQEASRAIEALTDAQTRWGGDGLVHLQEAWEAAGKSKPSGRPASRPAAGKPERTGSAREALGVGDGAPPDAVAPWDGELQVSAGDGSN